MKALSFAFWAMAAAMKYGRRATGPVAGVLYALLPVFAIPLTGLTFYAVARVIEPPFAPWAWGVPRPGARGRRVPLACHPGPRAWRQVRSGRSDTPAGAYRAAGRL